jgi:AcrR family transcriptional regulator
VDATTLLWEEPSSPRRGPRPTLSLAAITRPAIEIADADGLAAVTMQRVAQAVSVTKMALYRYVPGKVELVALMTDAGLGEPPRLGHGGWRSKLDEWARRMSDRFAAHPWTLETTVGTRPMGPNELGWLERAVAALAGTGLTGAEVLDVVVTVVGHVRAIAQQNAAAATDPPEEALDSAIAELLRGREDRFPALTAAIESAVASDAQDQGLDFGLRRILDGVELLIAQRAG